MFFLIRYQRLDHHNPEHENRHPQMQSDPDPLSWTEKPHFCSQDVSWCRSEIQWVCGESVRVSVRTLLQHMKCPHIETQLQGIMNVGEGKRERGEREKERERGSKREKKRERPKSSVDNLM